MKDKIKIKNCVAKKDGTLTRDFVFNSPTTKDFTIHVPFKEGEKHKYYIHPNTKDYVVMKDRGNESYPYAIPDELWLSKEIFKEYFI
jgi:hypothetical protein